ncbi:hypothetical protein ACVWW3_005851 [Bradyrhizobium sp. LM2.9]
MEMFRGLRSGTVAPQRDAVSGCKLDRFEAGTGAPSVVPATELRPDPFSVPLSSRGIARLDWRETKWLSATFWLARSTLRDGVEDLVSLDLKAAQD